MIEKFDSYARTQWGFVATKGDIVFDCWKRGVGEDTYAVALYRNKQRHSRPFACAAQGTVRWCREQAVKMLDRYS